MKKRTSTFLMIVIVAVIMLAVIVLINRQMIFQEGNPLPVAGGIWQLLVDCEPYAKIKDDPTTWVTREDKHDALFAHIEETYGVTFKQNTDNLFTFEGEGKTVTVSARQYSRSFELWELKP